MTYLDRFNTDSIRYILAHRKPKENGKHRYCKGDLAERIIGGIVDVTESECWMWGGANIRGYGIIGIGGKRELVHRISWSIDRGRLVPEGMLVCHHCDNPSCVNPKHLFIGTYSDNMRDCVSKGRHARISGQRPGENNSNAKLSQCDVDNIRLRLNDGETQRSIANRFIVSQSHISSIKIGRIWNHT